MRTKKFAYVLMAGAMVLSLLTITNTKAADNGRFSVGAELALPMGTFGDQSGLGFGGSLRYEMPMGDNLGLTGTVGYETFGGKDFDFGTLGKWHYTNSMIPIQIGAKYYFTEQQNGFYGHAMLGVTMFASKVEVTSPATPAVMFGTTVIIPAKAAETSSTTVSSTNLSFAPGIGYHLDNIDIGVSYQIISATGGSLSYLGIRLAYVFGEK